MRESNTKAAILLKVLSEVKGYGLLVESVWCHQSFTIVSFVRGCEESQ
jgi:hypothetical protein